MLMPGIHRNRKVTSLLPLESFLSIRIDPNRGGALAFENINGLFEQMSMRFERLARRDFRDVGVVESAGAFQIQKRRQAVAARFPRTQLELVEILDEQAAISLQAFRLFPLLVRRLVADPFFDFVLSGDWCISHDYYLRFIFWNI